EGRAGRIRLFEKILADTADLREISAVFDNHRDFHHIIHFGTRRREHGFHVSEDLPRLRLRIVLANEFTLFVKGDLASDVDDALTLGNNAERVWEWWLKNLRRCELHLRLFLRQTSVAVEPDERGGGDGARKSNSVSHGFPPGIEHCNAVPLRHANLGTTAAERIIPMSGSPPASKTRPKGRHTSNRTHNRSHGPTANGASKLATSSV